MRPQRNQRSQGQVDPHPEVVGVVRRAVGVEAHYREVEVQNHIHPVHRRC
jgi:hypothetical protein